MELGDQISKNLVDILGDSDEECQSILNLSPDDTRNQEIRDKFVLSEVP
jgi:hypothetical protein